MTLALLLGGSYEKNKFCTNIYYIIYVSCKNSSSYFKKYT